MPNPILEQINNPARTGTNNNSNPTSLLKAQINQYKQQLNQIKNLSNPQATLNQMLINNPQIQNVVNFIKQNGNDPKTAFYAAAKQLGVDPEEIIKQLQG